MRRGVLALLFIVGLTIPIGTSQAGPPGCTQAGFSFEIAGIEFPKRNDQEITVTPKVGNDQVAGACDASDVTIKIAFPHADGSDGDLNTEGIVVATGEDFLAGDPKRTYDPVTHTVNFDDGVFRGFVWLSANGTIHLNPPFGDVVSGAALGVPLKIIRPHVTFTVTPDVDSGPAPLDVTYTYTAENDSVVDPDEPSQQPWAANPVITDDKCSPVVQTGGDANSNFVMEVGETWTFSCSTSFSSPTGAITNHATWNADTINDGAPWPETTAQNTVTLNGPDMALEKNHTQAFTQGAVGRVYKLVTTNVGTAASTGVVTVTDDLPAALKATSISGTGWNCTLATLMCTRNDALASLASYPAITVKVDVKGNAPANVVNSASIERAGESTENDTDEDATAIAPAKCNGIVATIVGHRRGETIRGTNHRDVIVALGGDDVVFGRDGKDLICGGSGNDRLVGGGGKDTLLGGPGRDVTVQ